MTNADGLVGNHTNDNSVFCFAKPGEVYLVYLPSGGSADLDLTGATGQFNVSWFDPRNGGAPKRGSVASVAAGRKASLGAAPASPRRTGWSSSAIAGVNRSHGESIRGGAGAAGACNMSGRRGSGAASAQGISPRSNTRRGPASLRSRWSAIYNRTEDAAAR